MATKKTARAMRLELAANVDALYARTITVDEFRVRNRKTWEAIESRGDRFKDRVLAILRDDLPAVEAR